MSRARRITIANDNSPIANKAMDDAIWHTRRRRPQQTVGRAVNYHTKSPLNPGQMQWQPERERLQTYSSNTQSNPVSSRSQSSLSVFHIGLLAFFTVSLMASLTSLFSNLPPTTCAMLTTTTAILSTLGLSIPKHHVRKREFLGLALWTTAIISLGLTLPLRAIEFVTLSSILGFLIAMVARLRAPAIMGFISLLVLAVIVLSNMGYI